MRVSRVVIVVTIAVAIAILHVGFDAPLLRSAIAVGVIAVILRLGWAMIGGLAQPVPEPPEPGSLRKVKLTYRCGSCGAEVKMTVAASQDPEAPRHCMDDMELITPVEL